MKKILTVIMIGLLCLSTYSIFAPRLRAESEVLQLPAGAYYANHGQTYATILQNINVADQGQIATVAPGQTITIAYTMQIYCNMGPPPVPGEIRQAFFGYSWASSWPPWDAYTEVYNGIPGLYPGVTKSDSFTLQVPTSPGSYNVWFLGESQYSMQDAIAAHTSPPTGLPHAIIVVTTTSRPSPVGFWKFDEGSGSVAHDSAGTNEGVIRGVPSWTTGIVGGALRFDGAQNNYVALSSQLGVTDAMTVEAWVYPEFDPTNPAAYPPGCCGRQIIRKSSCGDDTFFLAFYSGYYFNPANPVPYIQVSFYYQGGGGVGLVVSIPGLISEGQWYHLVAVFKRNYYARFYVNGVEKMSNPTEDKPLRVSSRRLTIGQEADIVGGDPVDTPSYPQTWIGKIDEAKIYNYARTAEEIFEDYASIGRSFDPTIDGFGFSNYGRQADCMDLTVKQLYDEMDYIPGVGPRILLALYAYTLGNLQHGAGHCYGISRSAAYYYSNPIETQTMLGAYGLNIVSQVLDYNQIPQVRNRIEYEHVYGLAKNPNLLFKKVAYALEFYGQLPSLEAEVTDIIETVNEQGYAFATLCAGLGMFHSVVAYEGSHDSLSDTYTLRFYDSNWQFGGGPGSDGSGHAHTVQLSRNSQGKLYISYDQDTHIRWLNTIIHEDGSITRTWDYLMPKIIEWLADNFSDLWDSLMDFATETPELWNQFVQWLVDQARGIWQTAVELKLACPAELHVYDSGGNHVGLATDGLEVHFPAFFFVVGDTQQAILLNPEVGDYRVEIVGTGTGSYGLDLTTFDDGLIVDENSVSGEIKDGQVISYPIEYSADGTIVLWEHIFRDAKRNTVLRISTDDKYFQFTAPGKDFGIKQDLKMIVLKNAIAICYKDSTMRLVAGATIGKINFCAAVAWDEKTKKMYLLSGGPS